ncbi:uncharacterized protein DSM5745_04862 [Aspergillus mulundensis]|uniref:Uncharacterized protein n=1 Tax=Aspergillus mulundensis TaxID=1810919 RepID=A0A3D8S4U3_9EURO|nr:hypothetical protein DSM5745_04862 [Aspergillus mulundensis]RDW81305.1 hypothetical protein DSM5745_04862 [Aspergillus mulundensis]
MASRTEARTRTIYLMTSRSSSRQRAHFAIFVPSTASSTSTSIQMGTDTSTDVGNRSGTLINVIGAPMLGFMHEFRRQYIPALHSTEPFKMYPLSEVDEAHIVGRQPETQAGEDQGEGVYQTDTTPTNALETAACQIPAPGVNAAKNGQQTTSAIS